MTHGMKSRDGRRKIRISYQSAIGDTHQAIDICTRFVRDIPGHVPPPAVPFNNDLVSGFVNSPSKQSGTRTANRDPEIQNLERNFTVVGKNEAGESGEGETRVRPVTPFAFCPRASAKVAAVITKRNIKFSASGSDAGRLTDTKQ